MVKINTNQNEIQNFKTKQKNSEFKNQLLKAIDEAKKKGLKQFILEFDKPTYYSVIKRHLKDVKFSAKYDGYKITKILITL